MFDTLRKMIPCSEVPNTMFKMILKVQNEDERTILYARRIFLSIPEDRKAFCWSLPLSPSLQWCKKKAH